MLCSCSKQIRQRVCDPVSTGQIYNVSRFHGGVSPSVGLLSRNNKSTRYAANLQILKTPDSVIAHAEDEITITGNTDTYSYQGGSGYENVAHFCTNCHVRVAMYPEVMEGVVGIPVGTFDNANLLRPKLEIWRAEKLDIIKDIDGIVERCEDSGIAERLGALLEALENR